MPDAYDDIEVEDLIEQDEQAETKRTGRPPEYTDAFADEVAVHVGTGLTFKDSVLLCGRSVGTAARWLREYRYFREAVSRAKLQRKRILIASVRAAAPKDWRAALAMLQSMHPEEWSKRKIIELAKKNDKAAELIKLIFTEIVGDEDKEPEELEPIEVQALPPPSDGGE